MPWSVLRQTLQGIGTNCPALEDLQLYAQMVPMAIPSNTTSITVCALRHLLPCRTMKGLQISLWCDRATPAPAPDDFNPSDLDWNTIAEAWPMVESMEYRYHQEAPFSRLGQRGGWFEPPFLPRPKASMGALRSLVTRCPRIKNIDIPLAVSRAGVNHHPKQLDEFPDSGRVLLKQSWIDEDCPVGQLGVLRGTCRPSWVAGSQRKAVFWQSQKL